MACNVEGTERSEMQGSQTCSLDTASREQTGRFLMACSANQARVTQTAVRCMRLLILVFCAVFAWDTARVVFRMVKARGGLPKTEELQLMRYVILTPRDGYLLRHACLHHRHPQDVP